MGGIDSSGAAAATATRLNSSPVVGPAYRDQTAIPGRRYAYRLTAKGLKVALLFTLFHQRICGPLANSLFHHRPDPTVRPKSKLEAAYHKADASIQQIIELVQAA